MTSATESADPGKLEEQANATRDQVDQTLDALEKRFSVKRKMSEASEAIGAAATRASRRVSPSITSMIRLDHTHVLAAFRRYRTGMSPARKRALAANVCLALEIHAQLEEEIFYPALFEAGANTEELDRSISDHDEVRDLVEQVRQLQPRDAEFDQAFTLMVRKVLHHVADEETTLIPLAQTVLKARLGELGWKMTTRRMQLLRPHAGEAVTTTAMTFPVLTGLTVVGVLAGVFLVSKAVASAIRD
ncbi:MAG TPA: hemerythrin domain-containing protein [Steroidobacteraceae bacterium]|jgi:hypothetical protein